MPSTRISETLLAPSPQKTEHDSGTDRVANRAACDDLGQADSTPVSTTLADPGKTMTLGAPHAPRRAEAVASPSPPRQATATFPRSATQEGDRRSRAPGSRIGHYEILRELGQGGMGTVFLARDTRLARLVAIKLLTRLSGVGVQRFLVEARATARCKHENIVIIHEVNEHDGFPYMVLEYIEGQSLRDWMEQRRAPDAGPEISTAPVLPGVVVEMILPVVRALDSAHRAGIIHRDLKPENIVLDTSGAIKVVDFGIARLLEDETTGPASLRAFDHDHPRLTQEGMILGTLPYMSPEQLTGRRIDACSDIWAVGIILYELLLGAHPLAPITLEKVRGVMLPGPMSDVSQRHPELGALGAIVDRCLQKEKNQRFGSAESLLEELSRLALRGEEVVLGADESPFAGLSSFQETDATRFFGRDEAIANVTARLRSQPLVTIAGISGIGKSSLVRAGVIPRLKRSGEPWEALILRPGRDPMVALAALLSHPGVAASAGSPGPAIEGLAPERSQQIERLRVEPGHLGAVLRAAAARSERRWLVFIDQFEELFTLGAPLRERAAFFACLEGLADDASSPLRVIVSVRSDFVERMAEDAHFMAAVLRGLLFLAPIGREGLREALIKPLEAARYRIEDPAMIDDLLDALDTTRGALPLLQFTAAELWDRRDRQSRLVLSRTSYNALGGVAGALARHADRVLAGMSARQAKLARGVLERLVTPERTRAIAVVSELCEPAEDSDEIAQVVKLLADARLLSVMRASDGGDTVEIVHESLIESWPTLRRWIEENRDEAAFLDRLRGAARLWESSDRVADTLWRGNLAEEARTFRERYRGTLPERERLYLEAVLRHADQASRRRRRLIVAAMSALSLIGVGATLGLVKLTRQNRVIMAQLDEIRTNETSLKRSLASEEAARNAAEAAREESEEQRRRAEQMRLEAERSRDHAEAETERARKAVEEARSARDQARGAESLARQEEQKANAAAVKEQQSRQKMEQLVERAVGKIQDDLH